MSWPASPSAARVRKAYAHHDADLQPDAEEQQQRLDVDQLRRGPPEAGDQREDEEVEDEDEEDRLDAEMDRSERLARRRHRRVAQDRREFAGLEKAGTGRPLLDPLRGHSPLLHDSAQTQTAMRRTPGISGRPNARNPYREPPRSRNGSHGRPEREVWVTRSRCRPPGRRIPRRRACNVSSLTPKCWVSVWMSRSRRCSGLLEYRAVPPPARYAVSTTSAAVSTTHVVVLRNRARVSSSNSAPASAIRPRRPRPPRGALPAPPARRHWPRPSWLRNSGFAASVASANIGTLPDARGR